MLPHDSQRDLSGDTAFLKWRRSIDRLLRQLDARVATQGGAAVGTGVLWFGGTLPPGLVAANGAVVARADYPALFDVIGTAYNTGGESGTQFRLPNLPTPSAGVWTVRT
jgi:hypothetical protein